MSKEIKPIVSREETFDKLEIRLGRTISIEISPGAPKASYIIKADFGKFGVKTSVGRFTGHSIEELKGKQILGILNFEPRKIDEIVSEFLCLGVQYPKADSGEATIITPLTEAKIGGKLF
jgi:tRNA-binding protein